MIIQTTSDTSYDKIKNLEAIEDDIFAVFVVNSRGEANMLTVARNIDFENSLIENIFTNYNKIFEQNDKIDTLTSNIRNILGKLKWKVDEYEKIRILQIVGKIKLWLF